MRVLITGGAGFIGSHVVDAALESGHEVTILDDLSTGRRENLNPGARFVEGDLRIDDDVRAAVSQAPEIVLHLAAQIDVRRSVEDPAFDAEVNVAGTARLLEHVRLANPSAHVIFSSTGGAIYGDADVIPTSESHVPAPMAPYGTSKLCAEQYLWLYGRLHGLRTTAMRFGNVYGPRQDPLGEAGVCAIFCGLKVSGGTPTVYGSGHQTRDFVYVGDVAAAVMAAAARPDAASGRAFNVGRGQEVSVLDLVAALDLPDPELAPRRPGEIERSCLDITRIGRELGWSAQVDLETGLRRTLDAV